MIKLKQCFQQFVGLFYDANLYKDYVFRQKGYGIRLLAICLLITMIPSYFQLHSQVDRLLIHQIPKQIETLPLLHIENHRLNSSSQLPSSLTTLGQLNIDWLEKRYLEPHQKNDSGQIFLSSYALLYKLPDLGIFGLQLVNSPIYLPLYLWALANADDIDASMILNNLKSQHYSMFLFWNWFVSYMINLLYMIIFVRTFAFMARKMVLWFMKEELTYAVACRLLGISGVLPLFFIAIISYFAPSNTEESKYIYTTIYMFNFYFGVRMISARSDKRWLSIMR